MDSYIIPKHTKSTALEPPLQELKVSDFHRISRFVNGMEPYSFFRLPVMCCYGNANQPTRVAIWEGVLMAEYPDAAFDVPSLFLIGARAMPDNCLIAIRKWRESHTGGRIFAAESLVTDEDAASVMGWEFGEAPALHDYILCVERMVNTPTSSLRSKHKHAARFQREHPGARLARLDLSDAKTHEQINAFFAVLRQEGVTQNGTWRADLAAYERCLAYGETLPVEHHAVLFQNQIIAMQATEFSEDGDCYFAVFNRRLSTYRDVYDFFDLELARHAQTRGYRHCNIGEDMGLPNMRLGKSKWDPIMHLRMFELLPIYDG